jgi:hypothetical protein
MTDAYSHDFIGRKAAITDHQDLLGIVQHIKARRAIPRDDVRKEIFEHGLGLDEKPPTLPDQGRALNLAASLVLLMNFGVLQDTANMRSVGVAPIPWRPGVSVDALVEEIFPRKSVSSTIEEILPELRAKKLIKHAKLQMKGTNDVRRHLLLDKKEGIVWVFHQSTALRQLLRSSEDNAAACILPRGVMLEILDTIHTVLFPPDVSSQKLLASLVAKNDWDNGLRSDLTIPYHKDDDRDVPYAYFGDRLEELYEELQAPTPHGWLQRRLKRRSETYMLMATMYGVIIAVTLGFFSLVVAIFQAWVAWQQLKQPAN